MHHESDEAEQIIRSAESKGGPERLLSRAGSWTVPEQVLIGGSVRALLERIFDLENDMKDARQIAALLDIAARRIIALESGLKNARASVGTDLNPDSQNRPD